MLRLATMHDLKTLPLSSQIGHLTTASHIHLVLSTSFSSFPNDPGVFQFSQMGAFSEKFDL